MKKSFRRGFLLGIGLARLSAQKVSAEVKKFAKENKLDKKEAEKLAREFVVGFEKERKLIGSKLQKETKILEKRFRAELNKHMRSHKK